MADKVTSTSNSVSLIAVTGAVGAVVLLIVLLCSIGKTPINAPKATGKVKEKKAKSANKQKSKIPYKPKPRNVTAAFQHSLLVGTLKGHMDSILGLDLSPNGKYLATVSEDRSVIVWSVKEFSSHDHKMHRAKIELDHGNHVKFSPDSRAFLIDTYTSNELQIYKLEKKSDGTLESFTLTKRFPHESNAEVVALGIASSGKFIMACFNDTIIKLWDIQGKLMYTLDTKQVNNYYAEVSPCGRFIGSSGFTSDVKVWEVVFAPKTAVFSNLSRAFDLPGHRAAVYSFAFSNDSSRMATLSKDNTWKFWDTNVMYKQGEDPHLLFTGNITVQTPCILALAPDGLSVAISSGNALMLYSTFDGEALEPITDIYTGPITDLSFSHSNKYVVTCGDRYAHVFHNLPGYKSSVSHIKRELQSAKKDPVRARIQKQLTDAESSLASILEVITKNDTKNDKVTKK